MSNAASVKDRLKKYAKENGRTVQDMFTIYVLERILYRISISKYVDNFTLKGGILLYGLYTEDFTRSTTDIDLLGNHISNDTDALESVFREILSLPTDDPIHFDLDTIEVIHITEFKKYHGARITTTAYLDKTRIPVGIDIGFGDVIYPERIKMNYPTLLDDASPTMYVYTTYSMIAEKLEAIISLGVANSRYKDFYDLCTIPEREDFNGLILKNALEETFHNRHTDFNEIVAFEDDFTEDYQRQQRWRGFLKNKHVMDERSFKDAIEAIKSFLLPVIDAIRTDSPCPLLWNHNSRSWEYPQR